MNKLFTILNHHSTTMVARVFKTSIITEKSNKKDAQVMIEYLMTAGMLITTVVIFSILLYTCKEHSKRVIDMAAADCP